MLKSSQNNSGGIQEGVNVLLEQFKYLELVTSRRTKEVIEQERKDKAQVYLEVNERNLELLAENAKLKATIKKAQPATIDEYLLKDLAKLLKVSITKLH